jgi:glyoxalase family protein
MVKPLTGIHHVTAITGDAQRNVDFYSGVLGLRLVKKTVNFDDPGSYHLYYGDYNGSPGTLITFFAWPGAARGTIGAGEPVSIGLSIPKGSVASWRERVPVIESGELFGKRFIATSDPDGIRIELVEDADETSGGAIDRITSVNLSIARPEASFSLFEKSLGFTRADAEGARQRYTIGGSSVHVTTSNGARPGRMGAGTIHHVAFRVDDDQTQLAWLGRLTALDLPVSPVMDRKYFHSIYFREPGRVLFEIATDPPGMAIDEPKDRLGETLQLPEQYEAYRDQLERSLPPITAVQAARA